MEWYKSLQEKAMRSKAIIFIFLIMPVVFSCNQNRDLDREEAKKLIEYQVKDILNDVKFTDSYIAGTHSMGENIFTTRYDNNRICFEMNGIASSQVELIRQGYMKATLLNRSNGSITCKYEASSKSEEYIFGHTQRYVQFNRYTIENLEVTGIMNSSPNSAIVEFRYVIKQTPIGKIPRRFFPGEDRVIIKTVGFSMFDTGWRIHEIRDIFR